MAGLYDLLLINVRLSYFLLVIGWLFDHLLVVCFDILVVMAGGLLDLFIMGTGFLNCRVIKTGNIECLAGVLIVSGGLRRLVMALRGTQSGLF